MEILNDKLNPRVRLTFLVTAKFDKSLPGQVSACVKHRCAF